jgi:hypothetical protein
VTGKLLNIVSIQLVTCTTKFREFAVGLRSYAAATRSADFGTLTITVRQSRTVGWPFPLTVGTVCALQCSSKLIFLVLPLPRSVSPTLRPVARFPSTNRSANYPTVSVDAATVRSVPSVGFSPISQSTAVPTSLA